MLEFRPPTQALHVALTALAVAACDLGPQQPDSADPGGTSGSAPSGTGESSGGGGPEDGVLACCRPDGSCTVELVIACEADDGTWVDAASCDGDPCSKGACCTGVECSVTAEEACDGRYFGDATSCSSSICLQGACCEPGGVCLDLPEDACAGEWKGIDTACEPTKPCGGEPDHGACCIAGSCRVLDEGECFFREGGYAGHGVPCSQGICASGACCMGNACEDTNAFGCVDDYMGDGTRCAATQCQEKSACCFAGAGCLEVPTDECQGPGTSLIGVGADCYTGACSNPLGACCYMGVCATSSEMWCGGIDGSQYMGDWNACSEVECP